MTRSLNAVVRNEVAPRIHSRYGARSPRSSIAVGQSLSAEMSVPNWLHCISATWRSRSGVIGAVRRSRHIRRSARVRPGTGSSDSTSLTVSIPPTWARMCPVVASLGSAIIDSAIRAILSP